MSYQVFRSALLVMFPLLVIAAACRHDSKTQVTPVTPPPTGGGTTTEDTALCFERDILPIFISNCAKSGCHDAASKQDGYEFTSYQTITAKKFRAGRPDECELYEKITEDDPGDVMPPPPNVRLSAKQVELIQSWILRGAPNTTGCASNCDSSAFTFSVSIQPMLTKYCRGCHNTAGLSGGVNLDNYAGVKTVADDGRLIHVIRHTPGYPAMPRGGNKLSDCQIRQVEKWIAAGTPNN